MEPRDGDARKKRKGTPAAPARKKRKLPGAAAPPSLAPPPSARMGPGDNPTGAAAPPSLAPPPSVRTAHGDGGAPPAGKRKEGRRTDSEGRCSRNASTESSARGEGLAGRGGDPNDSGAVGVGHTTAHGSPYAPSATDAAAAAAVRGRIAVAHTPNVPPRFKGLVGNITSLVASENKGKSYECRSNQMNKFLKCSKSERVFFFEWSDDEMEMTWWMHDIQKETSFKFSVNAAFKMDSVSVERAAVAFSTNFIGDDEYWSGLKDMLQNMFGFSEDADLKEYDYLYVFTRVGDSICFRNFKIASLPKANVPSSGLWLTEINTTFCLKLVNDQGIPNSSDIGQRLTKNQTHTNLNLCQVYISSDGHMGSCLSHCVNFGGATYSILLENGPYVSSLENLEGFNISLAEIVVKEPLLKTKHIIGSATDKTHCFARQKCKSILQSLFAEFVMMFESGKCISEPVVISMHNVLVRATQIKLYGLHVTHYSDELAEKNVRSLVGMIKSCFAEGEMPIDLYELLEDLEKDPLIEIRRAKSDCSLLKAEDRRMLLINLNSEYMANVEAKSPGSKSNKINEFTFFDGCPYAEHWNLIMKDNEYMVQFCNVEESSEDVGNKKTNASVKERIKKKERLRSKNTARMRRMTKKKKEEPNKGKLQFNAKRNFVMYMPQMARKDGIFPFRLGLADYILTAYFPLFLRFVQKRMRQVKAQRENFKKSTSSWPCDG